MYEKSSRLSAAHRDKGNESYKNGDFFEALVFYNKALAFAESMEDLSLAYANRSAVYIEVKKYDECLQNIKWARENQYPKEKLEKLKDREEKCKNMMKSETKTHKSFFKLSYPPNPKIPFIVENLYMKKTEEFGRGVYAATDLKAGDVIAIDNPVFTGLRDMNDSRYKHCCYCVSSCMMNLIPCLKTSAVMFCSEDCQNKVYQCSFVESPANMVVPGSGDNKYRDKVMNFFTKTFFNNEKEMYLFASNYDRKNYNKSLFDFDFSNPIDRDYKKNLLHCVLALNHNKSAPTGHEAKNSTRMFNRFLAILGINSTIMRYQEQQMLDVKNHGESISLFGSLINHSCCPNISSVFVDNKIAYVVRTPIKANEQLFENYGVTFYKNKFVAERRQNLKRFNFICHCDACNNNDAYKQKFHISIILNGVPENLPVDRPAPKTYEDAVKEMKENSKEIDAGISYKNYMLICRNFNLLYFLAKLETFPQKI